MAFICPTITAYDVATYHQQLDRLKSYAPRLHIDIMDGKFTALQSVGLDEISWPSNIMADIHLMCQDPSEYLGQIIRVKPHLVVIHSEIDIDHNRFTDVLHKSGIGAGLAFLQDTPIEKDSQMMKSFDQILIFSGHLGYQGGTADMNLLDKVRHVRTNYPKAEIAWDGGINDQNVRELVIEGVNVLNVGSYIQSSTDAQSAYNKLMEQVRELNG